MDASPKNDLTSEEQKDFCDCSMNIASDNENDFMRHEPTTKKVIVGVLDKNTHHYNSTKTVCKVLIP